MYYDSNFSSQQGQRGAAGGGGLDQYRNWAVQRGGGAYSGVQSLPYGASVQHQAPQYGQQGNYGAQPYSFGTNQSQFGTPVAVNQQFQAPVLQQRAWQARQHESFGREATARNVLGSQSAGPTRSSAEHYQEAASMYSNLMKPKQAAQPPPSVGPGKHPSSQVPHNSSQNMYNNHNHQPWQQQPQQHWQHQQPYTQQPGQQQYFQPQPQPQQQYQQQQQPYQAYGAPPNDALADFVRMQQLHQQQQQQHMHQQQQMQPSQSRTQLQSQPRPSFPFNPETGMESMDDQQQQQMQQQQMQMQQMQQPEVKAKPVRPTDDMLAVPTQPLPQTRKQLRALAADVAEHVSALRTTMEADRAKHLTQAEKLKEEHERVRKQVLQSLRDTGTRQNHRPTLEQQQQQNDTKPGVDDIMPRWKHKLRGNMNPRPDAVIKSKRLWRVIVRALLELWFIPAKRVFLRKSQRKDKAVKECSRTLRIYLEQVEEWMGKLVTLPVSSLVQDVTLDFDLKDTATATGANGASSSNSNSSSSSISWIPSILKSSNATAIADANTHRAKTRLAMKVRLRAVLQGLSSAVLPSSAVTQCLVSLIEDDMYFPTGFLFQCEENTLRFNTLGGTRGVVMLAETKDECLEALAVENTREKFQLQQKRVLLQQEGKPVPVVEENWQIYRSIAREDFFETVLVELPSEAEEERIKWSEKQQLQQQQQAAKSKQLGKDGARKSSVVVTKEEAEAAFAESLKQMSNEARHLQRLVYSGSVRLMLANTLFVRVLICRVVLSPWLMKLCQPPQNRHVRRSTRNLRVLASILWLYVQKHWNPGLLNREVALVECRRSEEAYAKAQAEEKEKEEQAIKAANPAISTKHGASSKQKKEGEDDKKDKDKEKEKEKEKDDDEHKKKGPVTAPKGLMKGLLKIAGMADTTPGHEDFHEGSIEHFQLAPRWTYFDPLYFVLGRVLYPAETIYASLVPEAELDSWFAEWHPMVQQWFDKLVMHLLVAYIHKHRERLYLKQTVVVVPPPLPEQPQVPAGILSSSASVRSGVTAGGVLSAASSTASLPLLSPSASTAQLPPQQQPQQPPLQQAQQMLSVPGSAHSVRSTAGGANSNSRAAAVAASARATDRLTRPL